MIARYTRPAMGKLFSDENRYRTWLRVELAHLEALEEVGTAPAGTAAAVRDKAVISCARIEELEETLHHDVVAFLTSISERLGPEKKWLHYGMTSSDLVDTAQALILGEALDALRNDWWKIGGLLRDLAVRWREALMVGRTHGVHAEPTTFGFKMLGWYAESDRQGWRLMDTESTIGFGKLSGAVGTAAHLDPRIEEEMLQRLDLRPEPVATQVIPRDRHAHLLNVLAGIGSTCDRYATEIRHLQRTEVREVEEPFSKGQKGSSAMPHKRNPILCERISGLARLLRSYAIVGLENIPLWHERDISHSSAERIVLVDACTVLDYMIDRLHFVLEGLVVRPERMRQNLDATGGLVFSQKVLLALTEGLGDREAAYQVVQRHAMATWEEGGSFRDRLVNDSEVIDVLSKTELDTLFDPFTFIKHIGPIYDRVLASKWGTT